MTNKEIVAAFFQAGYVDHDYDRLMDLLADDYYDNNPCAARSNAQCAQVLRGTQAIFPRLTVELRDLIQEGDTVAVRVLFSGVYHGGLFGVPPRGQQVAFEALEVFRLAGGKIAESWGYWPDLQIKEQLERR